MTIDYRSRRPQAAPAGHRRPPACRGGAGLGPDDLHAAGRGRGARQTDRAALAPRARAPDRPRHRAAPRCPRAVGGRARGRLRRRVVDARHAARLRSRDARALVVRAAARRAHGRDVRRLGARASGQRLRRGAAAARNDGRAESRARGVSPRLHAPVRRPHRFGRRRHDGADRAHALRRAARRTPAADRGDPRTPGARRPVPDWRVSGAGAAGIRREDRPRVRLRLHARPAGQDRASVHDEAREGRRADHDAVPQRQPVGRAVLDAARGRPRDVRAGHRRRARRHAALWRHDGRGPREPVAAVGKPRRPQPALLAPMVRSAQRSVPGRAGRHRRRHVLPRDQQGDRRR